MINSNSLQKLKSFILTFDPNFSKKRGNTNIYRNYFFVKTVHDWNQLDNSTVSVTSVQAFSKETGQKENQLFIKLCSEISD
jgi:hypothetical protein